MGVKHLRGAFVQFVPTFLLPIPNVIVFQYNPETMAHSWQPASAVETKPGDPDPNPLAVRGVPGESFSFTFTDSRRYNYVCAFHTGMKASVTVR